METISGFDRIDSKPKSILHVGLPSHRSSDQEFSQFRLVFTIFIT